MTMTDKNIEVSVREELAQLRNIYVARMPAEFAALDELVAGLDDEETCRSNLDQLRSRLHKLAGSGGTFGLFKLSAHAREIEQKIEVMLKKLFEEQPPAFRNQLKKDIQTLHSLIVE